jgi:hypothetical protein
MSLRAPGYAAPLLFAGALGQPGVLLVLDERQNLPGRRRVGIAADLAKLGLEAGIFTKKRPFSFSDILPYCKGRRGQACPLSDYLLSPRFGHDPLQRIA